MHRKDPKLNRTNFVKSANKVIYARPPTAPITKELVVSALKDLKKVNKTTDIGNLETFEIHGKELIFRVREYDPNLASQIQTALMAGLATLQLSYPAEIERFKKLRHELIFNDFTKEIKNIETLVKEKRQLSVYFKYFQNLLAEFEKISDVNLTQDQYDLKEVFSLYKRVHELFNQFPIDARSEFQAILPLFLDLKDSFYICLEKLAANFPEGREAIAGYQRAIYMQTSTTLDQLLDEAKTANDPMFTRLFRSIGKYINQENTALFLDLCKKLKSKFPDEKKWDPELKPVIILISQRAVQAVPPAESKRSAGAAAAAAGPALAATPPAATRPRAPAVDESPASSAAAPKPEIKAEFTNPDIAIPPSVESKRPQSAAPKVPNVSIPAAPAESQHPKARAALKPLGSRVETKPAPKAETAAPAIPTAPQSTAAPATAAISPAPLQQPAQRTQAAAAAAIPPAASTPAGAAAAIPPPAAAQPAAAAVAASAPIKQPAQASAPAAAAPPAQPPPPPPASQPSEIKQFQNRVAVLVKDAKTIEILISEFKSRTLLKDENENFKNILKTFPISYFELTTLSVKLPQTEAVKQALQKLEAANLIVDKAQQLIAPTPPPPAPAKIEMNTAALKTEISKMETALQQIRSNLEVVDTALTKRPPDLKIAEEHLNKTMELHDETQVKVQDLFSQSKDSDKPLLQPVTKELNEFLDKADMLKGQLDLLVTQQAEFSGLIQKTKAYCKKHKLDELQSGDKVIFETFDPRLQDVIKKHLAAKAMTVPEEKNLIALNNKLKSMAAKLNLLPDWETSDPIIPTHEQHKLKCALLANALYGKNESAAKSEFVAMYKNVTAEALCARAFKEIERLMTKAKAKDVKNDAQEVASIADEIGGYIQDTNRILGDIAPPQSDKLIEIQEKYIAGWMKLTGEKAPPLSVDSDTATEIESVNKFIALNVRHRTILAKIATEAKSFQDEEEYKFTESLKQTNDDRLNYENSVKEQEKKLEQIKIRAPHAYTQIKSEFDMTVALTQQAFNNVIAFIKARYVIKFPIPDPHHEFKAQLASAASATGSLQTYIRHALTDDKTTADYALQNAAGFVTQITPDRLIYVISRTGPSLDVDAKIAEVKKTKTELKSELNLFSDHKLQDAMKQFHDANRMVRIQYDVFKKSIASPDQLKNALVNASLLDNYLNAAKKALETLQSVLQPLEKTQAYTQVKAECDKIMAGHEQFLKATTDSLDTEMNNLMSLNEAAESNKAAAEANDILTKWKVADTKISSKLEQFYKHVIANELKQAEHVLQEVKKDFPAIALDAASLTQHANRAYLAEDAKAIMDAQNQLEKLNVQFAKDLNDANNVFLRFQQKEKQKVIAEFKQALESLTDAGKKYVQEMKDLKSVDVLKVYEAEIPSEALYDEACQNAAAAHAAFKQEFTGLSNKLSDSIDKQYTQVSKTQADDVAAGQLALKQRYEHAKRNIALGNLSPPIKQHFPNADQLIRYLEKIPHALLGERFKQPDFSEFRRQILESKADETRIKSIIAKAFFDGVLADDLPKFTDDDKLIYGQIRFDAMISELGNFKGLRELLTDSYLIKDLIAHLSNPAKDDIRHSIFQVSDYDSLCDVLIHSGVQEHASDKSLQHITLAANRNPNNVGEKFAKALAELRLFQLLNNPKLAETEYQAINAVLQIPDIQKALLEFFNTTQPISERNLDKINSAIEGLKNPTPDSVREALAEALVNNKNDQRFKVPALKDQKLINALIARACYADRISKNSAVQQNTPALFQVLNDQNIKERVIDQWSKAGKKPAPLDALKDRLLEVKDWKDDKVIIDEFNKGLNVDLSSYILAAGKPLNDPADRRALFGEIQFERINRAAKDEADRGIRRDVSDLLDDPSFRAALSKVFADQYPDSVKVDDIIKNLSLPDESVVRKAVELITAKDNSLNTNDLTNIFYLANVQEAERQAKLAQFVENPVLRNALIKAGVDLGNDDERNKVLFDDTDPKPPGINVWMRRHPDASDQDILNYIKTRILNFNPNNFHIDAKPANEAQSHINKLYYQFANPPHNIDPGLPDVEKPAFPIDYAAWYAKHAPYNTSYHNQIIRDCLARAGCMEFKPDFTPIRDFPFRADNKADFISKLKGCVKAPPGVQLEDVITDTVFQNAAMHSVFPQGTKRIQEIMNDADELKEQAKRADNILKFIKQKEAFYSVNPVHQDELLPQLNAAKPQLEKLIQKAEVIKKEMEPIKKMMDDFKINSSTRPDDLKKLFGSYEGVIDPGHPRLNAMVAEYDKLKNKLEETNGVIAQLQSAVKVVDDAVAQYRKIVPSASDKLQPRSIQYTDEKDYQKQLETERKKNPQAASVPFEPVRNCKYSDKKFFNLYPFDVKQNGVSKYNCHIVTRLNEQREVVSELMVEAMLDIPHLFADVIKKDRHLMAYFQNPKGKPELSNTELNARIDQFVQLMNQYFQGGFGGGTQVLNPKNIENFIIANMKSLGIQETRSHAVVLSEKLTKAYQAEYQQNFWTKIPSDGLLEIAARYITVTLRERSEQQVQYITIPHHDHQPLVEAMIYYAKTLQQKNPNLHVANGSRYPIDPAKVSSSKITETNRRIFEMQKPGGALHDLVPGSMHSKSRPMDMTELKSELKQAEEASRSKLFTPDRHRRGSF